jgi:hypothetical protein
MAPAKIRRYSQKWPMQPKLAEAKIGRYSQKWPQTKLANAAKNG